MGNLEGRGTECVMCCKYCTYPCKISLISFIQPLLFVCDMKSPLMFLTLGEQDKL